MNKKIFKKHMTQGLGRCVLELKNSSDIEPYRDTVLWGCLHNIAYDAQCEGTRAEYMFRLVSHFDNPDYFINPAITKFLKLSSKDLWTFLHLCELLSLFADSGSILAQNALWEKYDALFTRLLSKKQWLSCDCFEQLAVCLTNLEGRDTFNKIANDLNELFKHNSRYDASDFDWFYHNAETLFKKSKPKILRNRNTEPITFDNILQEFSGTGMISVRTSVRFKRTASKEEQNKLIAYVLEESDIKKKATLLGLFNGNENILHHLEIIKYAKSDFEDLSKIALNILTDCKSPAVHDFACEILSSGKHSTEATCMLIQNYSSKDKELLLNTLRLFDFNLNGNSDWHWVTMKILDSFLEKAHLPKETLLWIYENSLCSFCRYRAVRQLAKHRWLDKILIDECRHDSNEDITKHFNRYYPI